MDARKATILVDVTELDKKNLPKLLLILDGLKSHHIILTAFSPTKKMKAQIAKIKRMRIPYHDIHIVPDDELVSMTKDYVEGLNQLNPSIIITENPSVWSHAREKAVVI